METVAAGTNQAIRGAWDAIQNQYPDDELTLQNRGRVLARRGAMPSEADRDSNQP